MMYLYSASHAQTELSVSSKTSQTNHGVKANSELKGFDVNSFKISDSLQFRFLRNPSQIYSSINQVVVGYSRIAGTMTRNLGGNRGNNQVTQRRCNVGDSGGNVDNVL